METKKKKTASKHQSTTTKEKRDSDESFTTASQGEYTPLQGKAVVINEEQGEIEEDEEREITRLEMWIGNY